MAIEYLTTQAESSLTGEIIPAITEVDAYGIYTKPQSIFTMPKYKDNGERSDSERISLNANSFSIEFSTHGAMITKLDLDGVQLIYQNTFETHLVSRDNARGQIPLMLPQISHDKSSKKPLPFHGYLQRSLTNFEKELSDLDNGIVVFSLRGSDILPILNPHNGIMHFVIYKCFVDGSIINSIQSFNFGDSEFEISPATHPYIRLNRDSAQNSFVMGHNLGNFSTKDLAKTVEFNGAENGQLLTAQLRTPTFNFQGIPLRGYSLRDSQIWVWTDSNAYICIENTSSGAKYLDRGLNSDSHDTIRIKPKENAAFSTAFVFSLNNEA